MKTEYIDSEIERMTAYEKTNDLSNYGQKILNELRSVKKQLTLTNVIDTLEQKEATYKVACEWFETEYDSNSDEDKVAEQEKVCYGLNEQIKLLRYLLTEYCA